MPWLPAAVIGALTAFLWVGCAGSAARTAPALSRVTTTRPYVALTFDDGPSVQTTPSLLDLLTRYRAHATFFVIGQEAQAHGDLVRQEVLQGSEVEPHTQTHRNLRRVPDRRLRAEVLDSAALVSRLAGRPPAFIRPPFGTYDHRLVDLAREAHLCIALWTAALDTRDWSGRTPQAISRQVLTHVRAGDIVLFHDGPGLRRNTLVALKAILPGLSARHLEAVTLATLWAARTAPSPDGSSAPMPVAGREGTSK